MHRQQRRAPVSWASRARASSTRSSSAHQAYDRAGGPSYEVLRRRGIDPKRKWRRYRCGRRAETEFKPLSSTSSRTSESDPCGWAKPSRCVLEAFVLAAIHERTGAAADVLRLVKLPDPHRVQAKFACGFAAPALSICEGCKSIGIPVRRTAASAARRKRPSSPGARAHGFGGPSYSRRWRSISRATKIATHRSASI
jgi:hypothetical protein